jgi:hypothetical protein
MRSLALALLSLLALTPAAAKDTGRIFVSNEKTNNITVMRATVRKDQPCA